MHIAAFCPPYASHLRAFSALAEALAARGHRVTFVLPQGRGPDTDHPGVEVHHLDLGATGGGDQLRAIASSAARTDLLCRAAGRLPDVDAILGDQTEPAAGLIAAHRGLPLIGVACALPLDPAPGVPLPFLGWPYDPGPRGLRRNAGGDRVADWILRRHNAVIRDWSARFGLPLRERMTDCLSDLLTLSQTLPGFDFPRPPGPIVETGPLRRAVRQPFPADIHPDPDRPFVYLSLGTVQGHRVRMLRLLSEACRRAGAQVLVCHAGGLSPRAAAALNATWVRDFVPQEAVLDRADLCITHAGLNTAMEALMRGVPMLAVPIAFDQPGVAARLDHHGVALRQNRRTLTVDGAERQIRRLLHDPAFRTRARAFGPGPGTAAAVDRIEAALSQAQGLVAAQ
ncbi:glycosyltransferase [Falsirhodobacter algicola]|uniref:Glycosyltransferase n=1 Tax=Falsirhodobacter algicola TaxID=2692330 RepID=A0A8J8MVS8_9RHOB|nr:glycosyltransferase [Falsirhodobacter algicola]QUS37324.1 glycosyltransferase [Falsirhodobacter algicola]